MLKMGFIPAYAGKYPGKREWRDGFLGSSPHARGNTYVPPFPRGAMWVHPRMRGEYIAANINFDSTVGSSPHARGILVPCQD